MSDNDGPFEEEAPSGIGDCEFGTRNDLNCNGELEAWEGVNEVPRVILGISSAFQFALHLYMFVDRSYAYNYGFTYSSFRGVAMTNSFLFSALISAPHMIFWFMSYIGDPVFLDTFWYATLISKWYYLTAYWVNVIFNGVWIGTRTTGETKEDPSTSYLIM